MSKTTFYKSLSIVLAILLITSLFKDTCIDYPNDDDVVTKAITKLETEKVKTKGEIKQLNLHKKHESTTQKRKNEKEIKINKTENKIIHYNNENKHSRYVLSYTSFGDDIIYVGNIETVALEANDIKLYSNWTIRIYHDNVPKAKQKQLVYHYPNLVFIDVRNLIIDLNLISATFQNISQINARVWRFLPLGDETVDIMCSRDLDSQIYEREEHAVKEWLNTNKILHIMRDNLRHLSDVMGGMWCYRNSKNRLKGQIILKDILRNAAKRYPNEEADKDNDQDLLNTFLYPRTEHDALEHVSYNCDMYYGSVPFPSRRSPDEFVGCIRPCVEDTTICPEVCRPKNHKDWIYC